MERAGSDGKHRVVITGMGLATSLGPDVPTSWRRLANGDNGITRIDFWDPSDYGAKLGAEVREIPRETGLESYPSRYCRRGVRIFSTVSQEALRGAGLAVAGFDPRTIGIACGVSVNYLDMSLLRDFFRIADARTYHTDLARLGEIASETPDYAFFRRQGDTVASVVARQLKIEGPTFVNDTACAASAHAIGEAYRMVRRGRVRAMVAGGTAALVSPFCIIAFSVLGALSRSEDPETGARPFDRQRDGFVMGEGGGAVVLESLESAHERGARIYAELTGFGSSLNAHTLTDPSPGGEAEARAMRQALRESDWAPEEVDYIAAHGTSTPKNDSTETAAIKTVFGDHAKKRLLVSSNKGQIGHTISAAGVCSLIFTLQAMQHRCAPPTMHLRNADPECDLDYVANSSRQAEIRRALVNAFAFGGQNAVLAVRGWNN